MFWGDYRSRVLNIDKPNLLCYYPLDDNNGTVCKDYSDNGHDGTYTGADIIDEPGPDGRLVTYFDGVNDYATIDAMGATFNQKTFSVSIWVKLNAAEWTDSLNRWALHIQTNTDNYFVIRKEDSYPPYEMRCSYEGKGVVLTISKDTGAVTGWNNVICTFSQSSDFFNMYWNGVLAETASSVPDWDLTPDEGMIGSYIPNPSANEWKGWIAHVAVWNDIELSASQREMLSKI